MSQVGRDMIRAVGARDAGECRRALEIARRMQRLALQELEGEEEEDKEDDQEEENEEEDDEEDQDIESEEEEWPGAQDARVEYWQRAEARRGAGKGRAAGKTRAAGWARGAGVDNEEEESESDSGNSVRHNTAPAACDAMYIYIYE